MEKREITLLDETGKVIFSGKITSFNFREELIIQKSIEFFNDEAPCFIHRSAVMKRLFEELKEFFDGGVKQGKGSWLREDLPENVKTMLTASLKDIHTVLYR